MRFLQAYQELFDSIRAYLTGGNRVYLVGGVVRDILLDKTPNDIDLVIEKDTRKISQKIANEFSGDFYALDEARKTYRVILHQDPTTDVVLDIAAMRGNSIEEDLAERDFTINAIALDVSKASAPLFVDPLSGRADVEAKVIRACSAGSLEDDPVRVLRAIRFANQFRSEIEENTQEQIKDAVNGIKEISAERVRDELFKALGKEFSVRCLEMYPQYGVVKVLFPSLAHSEEYWNNAAGLIEQLNEAMVEPVEWSTGKLVDAYQVRLLAYGASAITADRTIVALLNLSIILNAEWMIQLSSDLEESGVRQSSPYQFLKFRSTQLVLSNNEVEFLNKLLNNWNMISDMAEQQTPISAVVIYRFFKELGNAGLGCCLLALVELNIENQQKSKRKISVIESLLDGYFNCYEAVIAPDIFLNGHDLIKKFNLKPGPKFKEILSMLAEAQVSGEVHNRSEAFRFVEDYLSTKSGI